MSAVIIANWKMHGSTAALSEFAECWRGLGQQNVANVQLVLCPPAVYAQRAQQLLPDFAVGAQDCAAYREGAYTGDTSAAMLADIGCSWVIVGHSERRQGHGDTDAVVAQKARAAADAGLTAVVCVGESLDQRQAGKQGQVVSEQLQNSLQGLAANEFVIAYEPIWAIGTGHTATPEQANSMHEHIRQQLRQLLGRRGEDIALLYGGSVKPDNAGELLACNSIDGALVGGASLVADSFYAIAKAASESGRT